MVPQSEGADTRKQHTPPLGTGTPSMPPHGTTHEEIAKQLMELDEARAKDQLASLMTHITQMSLAAGAKASTPDVTSQSPYENSTASTSNAGYGLGSGSSSGHGSGSGGFDHGSGSGSGQGSGSGSGKGSGSGGSDGYCGDGSTGSGVDNSSDSSGNEDLTQQNSRRLASMGLPMKVEVGSSSLPTEQTPTVGKMNSTYLQHISAEKFQETSNHQAARLLSSSSFPSPQEQAATPSQASLADISNPLANLLEEVLSHVANTFPPEDAISVCSALANSLAVVLMRNANAANTPPSQPSAPQQAVPTCSMQTRVQEPDLQVILQELKRYQMQQELERQHMQPIVTPTMLDTAHQVATAAAQQAAAAWQQHHQKTAPLWQQAPTQWQQDVAFQQSAAAACDPRMLNPFFAGLPAHQNGFPGDVSLPPLISSLPPHLALPHVAAGNPFPNPYAGVATSVPDSSLNKGYAKGKTIDSNGGGSSGGGKSTGRSSKGTNQGKGAAHGKGGKAGAPAARGGQKSEGKGSIKSAAASQAAAAGQSGFGKSLRCNLEALHNLDCNRIVIVRKINRLGFESAKVMEAFFRKYGKVDRVLVSHSHAKCRSLRFRPSGLGFLVMSTAEEAEAVLADGPEIQVSKSSCETVVVNVQAYKPMDMKEFEESEQ